MLYDALDASTFYETRVAVDRDRDVVFLPMLILLPGTGSFGASKAQAATRDYVLTLDAPDGEAAQLSIFGGKITTYRRLAEAALAKLAPHLPAASARPAGWTGAAPLPGGDFPVDGFDAALDALRARYPFVAGHTLRRLLRAYGTCVRDLLGDATSAEALGQVLGADLTEAELRYLVRYEWAQTAADVVWRRSKLGLRMTPQDIARVDAALNALRSLRDEAA